MYKAITELTSSNLYSQKMHYFSEALLNKSENTIQNNILLNQVLFEVIRWYCSQLSVMVIFLNSCNILYAFGTSVPQVR